MLDFEWDEDKAVSNHEKHGVSFEEASTVFDDPLAIVFNDLDRSINEQRFIIIGESKDDELLFVVYTERNDKFRIIGAREATRRERRWYEERN